MNPIVYGIGRCDSNIHFLARPRASRMRPQRPLILNRHRVSNKGELLNLMIELAATAVRGGHEIAECGG
jgi:hypothetical protein